MTSAPGGKISLTGLRGMVARKMSQSLRDHAQLTYFAEVDLTELSRARAALKGELAVGPEDIVMHALARALRQFPALNARITGDAAELSERVDISVAISASSGLVAPAIFDVGGKSLAQIAAARRDLIERAGSQKLTIAEMTEGTFTISNLGQTPVQFFTPILNTPQVALLGLTRRGMQPRIAADNSVVARPVLGLSLTADHRFIDGDPAGRFLGALIEILESPHAGVSLPES
jgi:pyruvate dehydrogenase E2 component (dihydrolipoamide acetyltransferase)